jgi:hypothetical protein
VSFCCDIAAAAPGQSQRASPFKLFLGYFAESSEGRRRAFAGGRIEPMVEILESLLIEGAGHGCEEITLAEKLTKAAISQAAAHVLAMANTKMTVFKEWGSP